MPATDRAVEFAEVVQGLAKDNGWDDDAFIRDPLHHRCITTPRSCTN